MNTLIRSFLSRHFLCLASAGALGTGAVPSAQAVDFDKEIYPIFRSKCFKCHSGPKAQKGLRYDDKRTLKEFIDGEDKVIVTGKPEESLLLQKAMLPRDDTDAMPPPRRGDPMSRDEIRLVAQWIKEGAKLESEDSTDAGDSGEGDAMKKDEVHTWVNTEGNEVKAGFVRLEGQAVVLLLENGNEFPYALEKLSPESQALAKKLGTGE